MRPQIGGLGHKTQDLVIHFLLGEGETLLELHLRAITIRSELDIFQDQTGVINNITSKYITKMVKIETYLKIHESL